MSVERPGVTLEALNNSGEIPTLDAKLAAALSKASRGEFARRINITKEEYATKGMLLKGRQILWLVYQHYKTSEVEGEMLEMQDLLAVRMVSEDLRKFLNDWEIDACWNASRTTNGTPGNSIQTRSQQAPRIQGAFGSL